MFQVASNGKKLPAHKLFLAANLDYVKTYFTFNDQKSKYAQELKLPDLTFEVTIIDNRFITKSLILNCVMARNGRKWLKKLGENVFSKDMLNISVDFFQKHFLC